MTLNLDDTIAALASAPGSAARGIIRISGPDTKALLDHCFQPNDLQRWQNANSARRHPGNVRLDERFPQVPVATCFWPTARSYTGEPAAELHLIASPPLLEETLAKLYLSGIRPANPGEFTLRAFLAGRVDLVQAEAVLGVIDAHDHRELQTALKQLAGGISGQIGAAQSDLLNLLADLEAGLDFVEDDIEFIELPDLLKRLKNAQHTLSQLLEQASARMISTGRLRAVLAGLPNAGKSSLFNALAGEETALVSEIQGTTRDYLRAELHWNGTDIELIDTAGWEAVTKNNIIQSQAQSFRSEQFLQADLILWCTAADLTEDERTADEASLQETLRHTSSLLRVQTKSDLDLSGTHAFDLNISVMSNTGLNELINAAVSMLSQPQHGARQLVGMTAARSRESLQTAVDSLQTAFEIARNSAGDELVAIEVRSALDHLGAILGTVYTDDILDRIFSRFCIGK